MNVQDEVRRYIVDNILFGEADGLEADTSFQESGIVDSTGMLEIIAFVEEQFGITIGDDEVIPENLGMLRNISRFVQGKLEAETAGTQSR